jgi:hypothetical protein
MAIRISLRMGLPATLLRGAGCEARFFFTKFFLLVQN